MDLFSLVLFMLLSSLFYGSFMMYKRWNMLLWTLFMEVCTWNFCIRLICCC